MIEIKEYDVLTSNKEAANLYGYKHIDQKTFQQLEELVLTYNESEETDDAINFLSISSKRNIGKIIRVKNYVGVLQLEGGKKIEILPKIHGGTTEDTRKIFLRMLKTLKDFPSKNFNETTLNTEKFPIFEVFIRLFIKNVHYLAKRGLKSAYYEVEDNLNVFKGKMNFGQHIKQNIVHKERFYVQYDEFGLNRPENRLIKSTLEYLMKQSTSTENIKDLRQLLAHFELVDSSVAIEKDFSLVKIDRNSKDYEVLLKWAKVFLKKKSFTTFSGTTVAQSLLFPMDKLFESYVGNMLRKVLHDTDWTVSLQDRKYYLFEQKFALKPDIVLRNNEGRTIVMDTKWKVLKNDPTKNYGISQADMYQMYAYAKKYGTNEIVLIYPETDAFDSEKEIVFLSDDGVQVRIFLLNCHQANEGLQDLLIKANI